jgi:hypothetical protein
VKDLEELQMDQKNLYGKEFTPIFLKELNKASLNDSTSFKDALFNSFKNIGVNSFPYKFF